MCFSTKLNWFILGLVLQPSFKGLQLGVLTFKMVKMGLKMCEEKFNLIWGESLFHRLTTYHFYKSYSHIFGGGMKRARE